jgi:hypothetical protein
LDNARSENLYIKDEKASGGSLSLIAIAKYPNETANPNLLTRASFMEMIALERDILNATFVEENFGLCKK